VEQPHGEENGVETPTHAESFRDGKRQIIEADRLLHDARENVRSTHIIAQVEEI